MRMARAGTSRTGEMRAATRRSRSRALVTMPGLADRPAQTRSAVRAGVALRGRFRRGRIERAGPDCHDDRAALGARIRVHYWRRARRRRAPDWSGRRPIGWFWWRDQMQTRSWRRNARSASRCGSGFHLDLLVGRPAVVGGGSASYVGAFNDQHNHAAAFPRRWSLAAPARAIGPGISLAARSFFFGLRNAQLVPGLLRPRSSGSVLCERSVSLESARVSVNDEVAPTRS